MNYCIDFIPFNSPPPQAPWAMLYVFTATLKDGYWVSVN